MDDALAVRGRERVGDLRRQLERLLERNGARPDPLRKRRSLDELHHQVIGAHVIERADVGVVQGSDGARFAFEPSVKRSADVLMATSRNTRVSSARYTSPIPPLPSGAMTSYGPSLSPVFNGMRARSFEGYTLEALPRHGRAE